MLLVGRPAGSFVDLVLCARKTRRRAEVGGRRGEQKEAKTPHAGASGFTLVGRTEASSNSQYAQTKGKRLSGPEVRSEHRRERRAGSLASRLRTAFALFG